MLASGSAVLAAGVTLIGCDLGRPPASTAFAAGSLETRRFTLAGETVSIGVPAGADASVDGVGLRMVIGPRTRTPAVLRIVFSVYPPPAQPIAPLRWLGLRRNWDWSAQRLSGGSGGDVLTFLGTVTVDGRRVAVDCHAQGEFVTFDDAAWCAPIVETMRFDR